VTNAKRTRGFLLDADASTSPSILEDFIRPFDPLEKIHPCESRRVSTPCPLDNMVDNPNQTATRDFNTSHQPRMLPDSPEQSPERGLLRFDSVCESTILKLGEVRKCP